MGFYGSRNTKPHRLKPVLLKPKRKSGRGRGPAAHSAWAISKRLDRLSIWRYRTRSVGPAKLKKISKAKIDMQIPVTIKSSGLLNSFNPEIILPAYPESRNGPRVTFLSVPYVWYSLLHTPRSGMSSVASLKRLVKLAMQMVSVSSTI